MSKKEREWELDEERERERKKVNEEESGKMEKIMLYMMTGFKLIEKNTWQEIDRKI